VSKCSACGNQQADASGFCSPHRAQFERIYGKQDTDMGFKAGKAAKTGTAQGTSKVAQMAEARAKKAQATAHAAPPAKATEEATPEEAEEDIEAEETEDAEEEATAPAQEVPAPAPTKPKPAAAGGKQAVAAAAPEDGKPRRSYKRRELAELPGWQRRARAGRLLRMIAKRLSTHDWASYGVDGVDAARTLLTAASEKLAAMKQAGGKGGKTPSFDAGARVTIVEKHVETYRGVLDDDELTEAMTVRSVSKGYAHVATDNGQRAAIPAKHLQLVKPAA
jgi:hypothetical protein